MRTHKERRDHRRRRGRPCQACQTRQATPSRRRLRQDDPNDVERPHLASLETEMRFAAMPGTKRDLSSEMTFFSPFLRNASSAIVPTPVAKRFPLIPPTRSGIQGVNETKCDLCAVIVCATRPRIEIVALDVARQLLRDGDEPLLRPAAVVVAKKRRQATESVRSVVVPSSGCGGVRLLLSLALALSSAFLALLDRALARTLRYPMELRAERTGTRRRAARRERRVARRSGGRVCKVRGRRLFSHRLVADELDQRLRRREGLVLDVDSGAKRCKRFRENGENVGARLDVAEVGLDIGEL